MRRLLLLGSLALLASRTHGATEKSPEKRKSNIPAAEAASTSLPLLPPPTQSLTLQLVLERFEALDTELKSLSASFTQFVRWDASGTTQSVEGELEFRKPDQLRLEQRLPEPQTIVADGTWLWIHRKSTNQVIKAKFDDWKKSEPLAQGLLDFGHYAALFKSYDVSLSSTGPAGADGHSEFALLLRPKAKGQDFALTLRLSTRDYFPRDTELRTGGVAIHSVFRNIRYNPPLPEASFQFAPPAGADVFENVKPPKGK